MGKGAPVPVHREEVQLVFSLQNGSIPVFYQGIEKKGQVKVGVVGKEQGALACNQLRHVPAQTGFGDAPLP